MKHYITRYIAFLGLCSLTAYGVSVIPSTPPLTENQWFVVGGIIIAVSGIAAIFDNNDNDKGCGTAA